MRERAASPMSSAVGSHSHQVMDNVDSLEDEEMVDDDEMLDMDGKGVDMTPRGPDGQPLDPALYMGLLPMPGSNDNAWEQLMEIVEPTETAKLQEMVDRLDDKRDPHECVLCKRVLSCKSALQMHYRYAIMLLVD